MSGYDLGFFAGIFVTILIAIIVWRALNKDGKTQYDERQQLVRGKGFKYAYFTMVIYELCYVMIGEDNKLLLDKYVSPVVGVFIGIILSATVYAVYCIWNDGYYGINEKAKSTLLMLVGIALINIFAAFVNRGEIVVDGKAGDSMMNLLCGVMILVVVIVTGIKILVDKKHDGEEDDDE